MAKLQNKAKNLAILLPLCICAVNVSLAIFSFLGIELRSYAKSIAKAFKISGDFNKNSVRYLKNERCVCCSLLPSSNTSFNRVKIYYFLRIVYKTLYLHQISVHNFQSSSSLFRSIHYICPPRSERKAACMFHILM